MTEPRSSVLVVTEDGVIDVPGAMPVVPGLLETVERLFNSLGIPTRDPGDQPRTDPD